MGNKFVGGLQVLRDLLQAKLMGRSNAIEHGIAMLPDGRLVGPSRGTATNSGLESLAAWRDFQNARRGLSDETLPLWGTAHTHPAGDPVSRETLHWVDNGPSWVDVNTAAMLPKGADHQVLHPDSLVQEFYTVPSGGDLDRFARDVTGSSNTAMQELLSPRGYLLRSEGITLPDQFSKDRVGALNRAIQSSLINRGLLDITNTGSAADNAAMNEAIEALRKAIPFASGGAVSRG